LAKGGVAVEAQAAGDLAAVKANGQENGHVKTNGDVSAKPDGEAVDGNGTAEPAKEGETDAIEAAPAAEGDAAAKTEEAATKKKKKFSLKNSFKFKGINFKKTKKDSEEAKEEAVSPAAEDKPVENGHAAEETKDETPAAEEPAAEAAVAEEVAAAPESEATATEEAAPPTEAAAAPAVEEAPAEVTTPAASEEAAEQKAE